MGNSVSVIDTANNHVIATVTVGSAPYGVAVSPDGTLAYITSSGANSVSVVDTANNTVIATVTVGSPPYGVAVTPGGSTYITNPNSNSVSVISLVDNAAPVAGDPAYSVTTTHPDTGTVEGTVNVTDPNNDTLTYATPGTTAKGGSVTVNPDGSFTYTPTAAARHAASADTATSADKQDSFEVKVIDAHSASTTVPVTVAISPSNAAPATTGPTVGTPTAAGVVTGSVSATDPDADPLSYTGSTTTTKGTVVVNTDGTFTYTPTATARHNAAADTATTTDKHDNFTITVNDAHGGTTTIPVSVAVSPTNDAPVTTGATMGAPSPTGLVSGYLGLTDPNYDTLTYTVTGAPANGKVTVNPNGTFSYDPTDAARLRAGLTPETETDGFTITANDGHGASIPVTVAGVPVSPAIVALTATSPKIDNNGTPTAVAASPDGSRIYITQGGSNTVVVMATATNTVIGPPIQVGTNPRALAVSPDGSRVYVTNYSSGTVSVIDTATNAVTTIGVGSGPIGVAVSPDGSRAYVTNRVSNTVSVIDTVHNTVTTIGGFDGPIGIAVSPDGARAYVTNYHGNTVSVIDTAHNTVTTIGGFIGPIRVAVSPDGTHAYVGNLNGTTVSVIDTAHNTVTTIGGFTSPGAVAVTPTAPSPTSSTATTPCR